MGEESKIIITLDEYDMILDLGLRITLLDPVAPDWYSTRPLDIKIELTCPEWAVMRNKPLVRLLCRR